MTPREERGLIIAATSRLKRAENGEWLVPSQSHAETVYRVNLETNACTCPDCTEGGFTGKHFYAATIVHKRDVLPDGFEKMVHYYMFRREEFFQHYHKRSNVESTFSAVKRKFGDHVRSKTQTAMANEVLCKMICQNLCCVIKSQIELGIDRQPAEFGHRVAFSYKAALPVSNASAKRR